MDKIISTVEYNKRTIYECFNNPFTNEFDTPDLNLPPIIIDDRPCPHKRARYTPDLIPAAISVASENSDSTLTTPSDSPNFLPSDNNNPLHVIKKYKPYLGRAKR